MRKLAYECLIEVCVKEGYANLVLRQKLKNQSNETKGFVTDVVYGTLRNNLLVRFLWQNLAPRKADERIAVLLDMSVYQIFFTNHADYAVVNEMVKLAKEKFGKQVAGFVNTILRKACAQGRIEPNYGDPFKNYAVLYSIPEWMLRLWNAHYGEEAMKKIACECTKPSSNTGRINTLLCSEEEIFENKAFHRKSLSPLAVSYDGNMIASEEFKSGKIIMQDEGSQLIPYFMELKEDMSVLDACSAPGTKTTMMAALMNNKGKILACDLHEHRLKLVESGARHAGAKIIETKLMDSTRAAQELEGQQFDRVLLDVPCSGLGVLKRKPDIKLRINAESIDEIVSLQANILESCSALVKKGGLLVYSTCTLNRKENERQIRAFLDRHKEFERTAERTIMPFEAKSDGFYMVQCKKIM